MSLDAKSLRDFYRTPLGRLVRRQLAPVIRKRWKSLEGLTVAGSGFAAPFLGSFRTERGKGLWSGRMPGIATLSSSGKPSGRCRTIPSTGCSPSTA
jgi:hypothetical protein